MKGWKEYAQVETAAGITGGVNRPSVFRYAGIRIIDSGASACVFGLFVLLCLLGAASVFFEKLAPLSVWFFDQAKVCLAVFLGTFLPRGKRPNS